MVEAISDRDEVGVRALREREDALVVLGFRPSDSNSRG